MSVPPGNRGASGVAPTTADESLTGATGIAAALDRIVAMTRDGGEPSFAEMAAQAGLDPATDFIGTDLSGVDFRDEDLTGFRFKDSNLTGTDFRRASGLRDDALDGASVHGAIGLPAVIEARRRDGVIEPEPVTSPNP